MKKIVLLFFLFALFSPLRSQAVTFAVMGDTKDFLAGSGAFQSVVAKIKKKKPSAVLVVGDLINDCADDSACRSYWNSWKSTAAPILGKTYPVMGNHDRVNSSTEAADALWQEIFSLPANGPEGFSELVYSFSKGNSHFVVLNSSKPSNNLINSTQRAWLEQDLAANQKKKQTFVFFHSPAYPASLHIGSSLDYYPTERDALWEILDRYKVSGVFVGHEHFFNRRLINSSVFPGAASSIYQFTVGRTDVSETYPTPQAGMSEYYALEQSCAIVNAKKKA
ncbi:MAG: metallophosphoesterase [Patescibacteria group bacterium]|nr:metallophosphoesterase [Patescibacteria group bacterium]